MLYCHIKIGSVTRFDEMSVVWSAFPGALPVLMMMMTDDDRCLEARAWWFWWRRDDVHRLLGQSVDGNVHVSSSWCVQTSRIVSAWQAHIVFALRQWVSALKRNNSDGGWKRRATASTLGQRFVVLRFVLKNEVADGWSMCGLGTTQNRNGTNRRKDERPWRDRCDGCLDRLALGISRYIYFVSTLFG